MQRLLKIDYISTVSGGSNIAGWMLAHHLDYLMGWAYLLN